MTRDLGKDLQRSGAAVGQWRLAARDYFRRLPVATRQFTAALHSPADTIDPERVPAATVDGPSQSSDDLLRQLRQIQNDLRLAQAETARLLTELRAAQTATAQALRDAEAADGHPTPGGFSRQVPTIASSFREFQENLTLALSLRSRRWKSSYSKNHRILVKVLAVVCVLAVVFLVIRNRSDSSRYAAHRAQRAAAKQPVDSTATAAAPRPTTPSPAIPPIPSLVRPVEERPTPAKVLVEAPAKDGTPDAIKITAAEHATAGIALINDKRYPEAVVALRQAVALEPSQADHHGSLGMALACAGHYEDGIREYREALRLNPAQYLAANNLAYLLATHPDDKLRDGTEALRLAKMACEGTHYRSPQVLGTLSAAYAEAGLYALAIETGTKALHGAKMLGKPDLIDTVEKNLELYRQQKPVRLEAAPAIPLP